MAATSQLPPQAAFVLQLEADVSVDHDGIAGRIEHVSSGCAARFTNLPELLAFIGRMLATVKGQG